MPQTSRSRVWSCEQCLWGGGGFTEGKCSHQNFWSLGCKKQTTISFQAYFCSRSKSARLLLFLKAGGVYILHACGWWMGRGVVLVISVSWPGFELRRMSGGETEEGSVVNVEGSCSGARILWGGTNGVGCQGEDPGTVTKVLLLAGRAFSTMGRGCCESWSVCIWYWTDWCCGVARVVAMGWIVVGVEGGGNDSVTVGKDGPTGVDISGCCWLNDPAAAVALLLMSVVSVWGPPTICESLRANNCRLLLR